MDPTNESGFLGLTHDETSSMTDSELDYMSNSYNTGVESRQKGQEGNKSNNEVTYGGAGGTTLNSNGSINVYSLLHYASSCSDLEIFTFVLDQCTNLEEMLLPEQDRINVTNETPLHFAVSCNNIEIVRVLVDKMREIREKEVSKNENRFFEHHHDESKQEENAGVKESENVY